MKKTMFGIIGLIAAIAVVFLCVGCDDGGGKREGGEADEYLNSFLGTFKDSRDGQTYRKVKIGEQTWMAENLNYNDSSGGSWCYHDTDSYCDKYGRLYDWATAMAIDTSYNNKFWNGNDVKHKGICPSGWHLPSEGEWNVLIDFAAINPGKALKAKTDWDDDGRGDDTFLFSALPGGRRFERGGFDNYGRYGYWWTATETPNWDKSASFFYINDNNNIGKDDFSDGKLYGFSVRCLLGVSDSTSDK